jgi:hypothetical protein
VLPQILPSVLAGFLLAFTFSFDDFIVAFFVAGSKTTLPIYVFASIRRGVTPEINAIATMVLVASLLMILIAQLLMRDKTKKSREHHDPQRPRRHRHRRRLRHRPGGRRDHGAGRRHVVVADRRPIRPPPKPLRMIRDAGGSAEASRLDVTDDAALEPASPARSTVTAASTSCTIMPARRWRADLEAGGGRRFRCVLALNVRAHFMAARWSCRR